MCEIHYVHDCAIDLVDTFIGVGHSLFMNTTNTKHEAGRCICCNAKTLYPDENLCVPCADEAPTSDYGYQDDDVAETAAELTRR